MTYIGFLKTFLDLNFVRNFCLVVVLRNIYIYMIYMIMQFLNANTPVYSSVAKLSFSVMCVGL